MTERIIKFRPEGKPEQLRREDLKGMSPEDINRAREGGHLADLLAGKKPAPAEPESQLSPFDKLVKDWADKAVQ